VRWVSDNLNFDKDATVSVFETNIRVLGVFSTHLVRLLGCLAHDCHHSLGGLLSAHLLASDAATGKAVPGYNGRLLQLARELGERLLPAFNTPTGIPYGSVHLRRGVAQNESRVSSTAGGGTLVLEFGVLSKLTGDPRFEYAAKRALRALWSRRSGLGLVGAHIDVISGTWTHRDSGVGTSVDSFFEYLWKCGALFGDPECGHMFGQAAAAVERHCGRAPWYVEVNMDSGTVVWPLFNALQAFWPGLLVLAGRPVSAAHTHAAFLSVWRRLGFTPEGFNLAAQAIQPGQGSYPLRPELAESTWYLYRATGDPSYLSAGRDMVVSLRRARGPCGYATVADVRTGELTDGMESFFLSETVKYLFLLFDAGAHYEAGRGNVTHAATVTESLDFNVHSGGFDQRRRHGGGGGGASLRASPPIAVALGRNVVDNDRGVEYLFTTEGHYVPVRQEWRRQGPAGHDGVGAPPTVAASQRNASEDGHDSAQGDGGGSSSVATASGGEFSADSLSSSAASTRAGASKNAVPSWRLATAATDALSGASGRVTGAAGRVMSATVRASKNAVSRVASPPPTGDKSGNAHSDGLPASSSLVAADAGTSRQGPAEGSAHATPAVVFVSPSSVRHTSGGTCPALPSDLDEDDEGSGGDAVPDSLSSTTLSTVPPAMVAAMREFGPASPAVRALAAEVAAEQQRLVANHLLSHVAASGVPLSDVQLHVTDTGDGLQRMVLWLNQQQQQPLWATNAPALLPNGLLAAPSMLPQAQAAGDSKSTGGGQCGVPGAAHVVQPPQQPSPRGSVPPSTSRRAAEDDDEDEYESPSDE
jgi:Glycosyl hydrolase family 47